MDLGSRAHNQYARAKKFGENLTSAKYLLIPPNSHTEKSGERSETWIHTPSKKRFHVVTLQLFVKNILVEGWGNFP